MAEAKSPLLIRGFHGMGDCLHMRAIIHQLRQRHDVWLETSWPCIYDDFTDVKFLSKRVNLRTQTKNAARSSEAAKFSRAAPPGIRSIGVAYNGRSIGSTPSKTILETLCAATGCDFAAADFRMPVPDHWKPPVQQMLKEWNTVKPIMVYRPLTARPEWAGGAVRNANETQYAELLSTIRDDFFVVSVADLVPGREWIVGPKLKADVTFHKGELVFEQLAALFSRAALVFTSGGFGTLLAMAVETPVVSIIGGYERASWASAGARFSPFLGIEPIEPCSCGGSCGRYCAKVLDMPVATAKLREFLSTICPKNDHIIRTPLSEMFDPAETTPRPTLSGQQLQLQRAMIARANMGMRA
jgi:hypothetical protein